MSKAHRGTPLKKETPGAGRGECPLCKRSGIKLLYSKEFGEKKVDICKQCKAATANGKMQEAVAAL